MDILKNVTPTWREIASLARPIDSKKPVHVGTKTKTGGDFEAYTDNKSIYINVSDEKKFKDNFEKIIVPAYKIAANRLYDVRNSVSDEELLRNLIFDAFLFIHFHEQMHPWLCPNTTYDEKTITKHLYEGIQEAEPRLSKAEAMFKVNNCKNLIWDIVLNVSFISKTAGYNNDTLEQKINYVFEKDDRQIEYQPLTHYPSGILPILYMTSAQNNTTDVPISLVGAMYATMSYNDARVRSNAIDVFLKDLQTKKIDKAKSKDILQQMYAGFVSEISDKDLARIGIDKADYQRRINLITDFTNSGYEDNQKYFVSSLTRIFDTPDIRYSCLKGFIKSISKYISLSQKQGSPDPNTMGQPGSGSGQGEGGESGESGGESGDSEDGDGSGGAGDKSQEDMDGNSMDKTLDDLLGTLDEKEADGLLDELGNGTGSRSRATGAGGPGGNIRRRLSIIAIDEFYKRHADALELQNPSQENIAHELGAKKVWKLKKSSNLTAVEVAKLNHKQIMSFMKATKLPVLVEARPGSGLYKYNEYKLVETPLKSFNTQLTGIEIPDNWVFFQDSSGSMTCGSYVGSGDKFDLLNRVKYGLMKGLYTVCKELKKDLMFGVVDFSNTTRYSGLDSLIKIYESRTHPIKGVSLTPQCGGTSINSRVFSKIKTDLKPGKSIYTFITDGQIDEPTQPLYDQINSFAADSSNAFVFVEIGVKSNFGNNIQALSRTNNSVLYYHVTKVGDIKDKLGSVLVRYT